MNPHSDTTDEEADGEFQCLSKKQLRDEDFDPDASWNLIEDDYE